jgi:hypothetical protein
MATKICKKMTVPPPRPDKSADLSEKLAYCYNIYKGYKITIKTIGFGAAAFRSKRGVFNRPSRSRADEKPPWIGIAGARLLADCPLDSVLCGC